MAEFPALKIWTDAYLGDTHHLTTIEHGAYYLLLLTAWRSSTCDLPDDDKLLARYCRLTKRQWQRIRPTIEAFWTVENGRWWQGKLRDERDAVRQHSKLQSDKGKASALKRKNRNAAAAQPKSNLHPHITDIETDVSISPTQTKKPKKRATRIPDDWQPTQSDIDYARSKGMTDDEIRHHAEEFRNYWAGEGGRSAAKLNWSMAWKKRVLNLVETGRVGRMGAHPGQPTTPGRHKRQPASFAQAAARVLAKIEDGQRSVGNGADTTGFPECDTDSPPLLLPGASEDDH